MTPQEAKAHLKHIHDKADKAFSEEFGIPATEYSEYRATYVLGLVEAAFLESLIKNTEPVLS